MVVNPLLPGQRARGLKEAQIVRAFMIANQFEFTTVLEMPHGDLAAEGADIETSRPPGSVKVHEGLLHVSRSPAYTFRPLLITANLPHHTAAPSHSWV